jgi:glycosyltransferase involved in cell wall biosynthesis
MRVAVVYHVASPGGLTRFTHALIDGLLRADRGVAIDYFVSDRLLKANRVPPFTDASRVRTMGLSDPDVVDSNLDDRNPLVQRVNLALSGHRRVHAALGESYLRIWSLAARIGRRKPAKHWYQFALSPEVVDALGGYDVVYLPFPYYIDPAQIAAPVVGTFHDMNHKHFPANFHARLLRQMDRQIQFWTTRVDAAVVSTRFIELDLLRYYPGAAGRTSIVYVPPYSSVSMPELARQAVLARFGLRNEGFILYPSNQALHKNLLGLVSAADIVKRQDGHLAYPIVLTGFGTGKLGSGKVRSFAAVDKFLVSSSLKLGQDVVGLDFVTDEEIDALTQCARLVVSTSLYEAGCGPALDAWQFGVPVAFSDIPPFLEQLEVLGVEAWTFDPRNPRDVARVLARALSEREVSLAMATRSKEAISGHSWQRAGEAYLRIFEQAIEHHRRSELTQPASERAG